MYFGTGGISAGVPHRVKRRREDLDLPGRRAERVRHRVVAEVGEAPPRGFVTGHGRARRRCCSRTPPGWARPGTALPLYSRQRPLHPVAFAPALRVGRPDAQSAGDVGADAVVALRLARRFDDLRREEHLVAVLPAVRHAPCFELRAGGQDEVREARRGRQEVVLHGDELDEPFVLRGSSRSC